MANKLLHKARKAQQDEFYSQLADIELEMRNYKEQFKDKIIFCNCDDPYESNFFKFFAMRFNVLGLKKLIATCYIGSPIANRQLSLFDHESVENKTTKAPHKIEIVEVKDYNEDGAVDLTDVEYLLRNKKNVLTRLQGDGDFRSKECIQLLREADIVVTNPPFSLFREYIAQLVEHDRKFIVTGNTNSLTYKEIFKLIQENKLRTGYTNFNVGMYFFVPDTCEKYHKIENGQKFVRVSTSCWFTNLEVRKHKEHLTLYKRYSPSEYLKYDNYDAINVDKTADIPCDYEGIMGVPVTFLDKYNPEQFEIIALGNSRDNFTPNKNYINPKKILKNGTIHNGGAINCVLAIETNKKPIDEIYYISDNSSYLIAPYARVLIKNKNPRKG